MESDYSKPINIVLDRLVSINKLAELIIKISGKKIDKIYDINASQSIRGRNADLTFVKKDSALASSITLEDGLEKTYNWKKTQM